MKLFEITFTLNPEFHSLPTHIFLPGSLFWPFLSASSFPPIVIFLSNTSYLHFTLPTRLFYPSLDLFLPMTLPTCLWCFHQSLPTLLLTSSYLTLPTQLFLPMTLPTRLFISAFSYPPLDLFLFSSSYLWCFLPASSYPPVYLFLFISSYLWCFLPASSYPPLDLFLPNTSYAALPTYDTS